jgi:hypothetical protein
MIAVKEDHVGIHRIVGMVDLYGDVAWLYEADAFNCFLRKIV